MPCCRDRHMSNQREGRLRLSERVYLFVLPGRNFFGREESQEARRHQKTSNTFPAVSPSPGATAIQAPLQKSTFLNENKSFENKTEVCTLQKFIWWIPSSLLRWHSALQQLNILIFCFIIVQQCPPMRLTQRHGGMDCSSLVVSCPTRSKDLFHRNGVQQCTSSLVKQTVHNM